MEACLYEALNDGNVRCHLCSHRCLIKEGGFGRCKVRQNNGGVLESLVYSKLVAINPDPIEKKPLYHFMPGSLAYSIATAGCNFRCAFCQNAEISQMPRQTGRVDGKAFSAADVVDHALESGCQSIAHTYTEPTINMEFAYDTGLLAHEKGLKNVFVSNGYMTPEAIDLIAPCLDAINIDLKSFSDDFYREICQARLEPVLESLRRFVSRGILVEVTTLLIPGKNDEEAEIRAMAEFIADDLGVETPWHISRFHPAHEMKSVSPTPVGTLTRARDIGLETGLQYVYIGNVGGHPAENTYCPQCGKLIVERAGHFTLRKYNIKEGYCFFCGALIPGYDL